MNSQRIFDAFLRELSGEFLRSFHVKFMSKFDNEFTRKSFLMNSGGNSMVISRDNLCINSHVPCSSLVNSWLIS